MSKTGKFLGQEIPPLDNTGLRQFGLIFSAIIAVLFGLLFPLIFSFNWPVWPWIVAAIVSLLSLIAPGSLGSFYQIWMRFGVIMNIIMSRLILGTVFVLTVIPTGLIFKLRRKDILQLKSDETLKSYRHNLQSHSRDHLKKPY